MKNKLSRNLKHALMLSGISEEMQNKSGFFVASEKHIEQICEINKAHQKEIIHDLANELENIWNDLASGGAIIPKRIKRLLKAAKGEA